MFYRERLRRGETAALAWMDGTFNEDYPRRGMVFAIGNQAKRPQVWQLLGVIRLDERRQAELTALSRQVSVVTQTKGAGVSTGPPELTQKREP